MSNHLYAILPHPSGCPSLSDHSSTIYTSPSDHPSLPDHLYDKPLSPSDCPSLPNHLYDEPTSPSACPSPSDCLIATMTHLTICLSFTMIQHTQDSSQSLAVMNGEQSHKAKKFCRVFTNYDLLLRALGVSSIYPSESRHVGPPKSGEDAHVTCGMRDLGGPTRYQPRLGFSYVLPRIWDPGGVRSMPNVPTMPLDRCRSLAPSRYPYTPHKGHLVNLTSLRRWQDIHTFHMILNIIINVSAILP